MAATIVNLAIAKCTNLEVRSIFSLNCLYMVANRPLCSPGWIWIQIFFSVCWIFLTLMHCAIVYIYLLLSMNCSHISINFKISGIRHWVNSKSVNEYRSHMQPKKHKPYSEIEVDLNKKNPMAPNRCSKMASEKKRFLQFNERDEWMPMVW